MRSNHENRLPISWRYSIVKQAKTIKMGGHFRKANKLFDKVEKIWLDKLKIRNV